jgi:hypothetical protein
VDGRLGISENKAMRILISTFFTLLLIGVAGRAYAQFGLSEPSDYDECIIEGMQGIQSVLAASYVAISCREKFPIVPVRTRSKNTCLFTYSMDEGFARVTQREWDSFASKNYESTPIELRDGLTDIQGDEVMAAWKKASADGNRPLARRIVNANMKSVKFPKGLTVDYVLSQNIPYCAK